MLTKKETAILLIVTFIPFSLYLFSPNLIGVDGFAFLNHVCGIMPISDQPLGIYPILDMLPC
ncbi:MAG: hypothetical protein KAJ10_04875, partial [Thermodesulfovibrionia bacterium]|nr:hypothetical protein [Thermodesulfovibrionia bacterium]